jgi:hypothetical protein
MICDICKRRFNYCFYIDSDYWLKAVGAKNGHWCAHCVLERLGGLNWYIIWNEQAAKIIAGSRSAECEERNIPVERGHTNYCRLPHDHEGDCVGAQQRV